MKSKNNIFRLLFTVFILISLQICIFLSNTYAVVEELIYEGIDVSAWQGRINYNEVRNAGIEIVYIKSSEGSNYIDPYFRENYENAKENDLKVGFYHYVTARTIEEAEIEARFFVSVISDTTPDCRLAVDFESFGNLNREEINEITLRFVETVEELSNKEIVIYSDLSNARDIFTGEITKYPLWLAEYGTLEPSTVETFESTIGWQFTDRGNVQGINGNVDRNRFAEQILLTDNTTTVPLPEGTIKPKARWNKYNNNSIRGYINIFSIRI